MVVITPSYSPDFDLCLELNRSVLEFAPDFVEHHILVPRSDCELFADLAGPRTRIRCREELLPANFLRIPQTDCLLNIRWPFLPVRGWVEQQLVKLAAASECTDGVVLLVDSDVQFLRRFDDETFRRNGSVRFYRLPSGVDAALPRHVRWHQSARELLGIPLSPPPYSDYISSMIACDPAVVRQMLNHVEVTSEQHWASAIGKQVHFSEWTLYGVFLDEVTGLPANAFVSDQPLCLGDWSTKFTKDEADEFLNNLGPDDVAAMISSKSGTPISVRRAAFADWRARWANQLMVFATFAMYLPV